MSDDHGSSATNPSWRRTEAIARRHVELLRKAGCTCPSPLLGYRPEVGPRCRLCNRVAPENGRSTDV